MNAAMKVEPKVEIKIKKIEDKEQKVPVSDTKEPES